MSRYRRFANIFVLMLCISVVSSCREQTSDSVDRTDQIVVDGLGNEIILPSTIRRIVTLAPGVTEIVAEAGGLNRIVGVSNADDFPTAVLQLPNFSALPVNFEAVTALDPDVVFAATQVNNNRDAQMFGALGIPAYYLSSRSIEETLASIEMVGELIGTREVANRAVAELRSRMESLREKAQQYEERPRVLFLISAEALHSFGPESYVHDLIELAGGTSITSEIDVENPILSEEFVLTMNPDVIVGTFGKTFEPAALLEMHPTWTLLSAVQSKRVFNINGDLVLRAGPRIVAGAEQLFTLIHPQRDN